MPEESVICARRGHIASIRLNRPDAGNIIDERLALELADACQRMGADGDIYAVVLTGAGDSFCLGGETGQRVADSVAAIEQLVIAAVNGDAFGQGLELALACDIRLASEQARFGLPQLTQGLIPSDGGTQRLPRIVGRGKALELLLGGGIISAGEALEIGLVNRLVEKDKLEADAEALAAELASKAPISLRFIKEAVGKGLDLTLEQGLRLEADLYFLLHTTRDRTEGITAFLNKQKPRFEGK